MKDSLKFFKPLKFLSAFESKAKKVKKAVKTLKVLRKALEKTPVAGGIPAI